MLFCMKDYCAAFLYLYLRFSLFRCKNIGSKATLIMLVKMTQDYLYLLKKVFCDPLSLLSDKGTLRGTFFEIKVRYQIFAIISQISAKLPNFPYKNR